MCSGLDRLCGGVRVTGSVWYSKKRIVCGAPFSVIVKSLAVSPFIGAPCLSVAVTASITNCVPLVKVAVPLLSACAFPPVCCAAAAAIAIRNPAMIRRMCQNLTRSVVCRLRIALAAEANPNCALFTVVFHAV